MDWMQLVAALVNSLAWPVAAVIAAILLRSPLAKLLPMMRAFKFKELSIDFSEKLEAVKEEIDAKAPSDPPQIPYIAPPSIAELARIDPRAAILSAWVDVERAMLEMATKAGTPVEGTPHHIASCLHLDDYLGDLEFETFKHLRRLRSQALHLNTVDLTPREAEDMAGLCQWLAHRMRTLTAGIPQKPGA